MLISLSCHVGSRGCRALAEAAHRDIWDRAVREGVKWVYLRHENEIKVSEGSSNIHPIRGID